MTRTSADAGVGALPLIASVWSAAVSISLVGASQGVTMLAALLAAAVSVIIIIIDPQTLLVSLPFFALLSPIAGFVRVGGAKVVVSDLLFVVLAVQVTLLFLTGRLRFYRTVHGSLLMLLAGLYCCSALAGLVAGTLASFKPLGYLSQFVVLYIYTAHYVSKRDLRPHIIDAWLVATLLGALLLIRAYATGVALNEFDSEVSSEPLALDTLHYLFQARYYYTGFHYVLGIAIVVAVLQLFLSHSGWRKLLTAIALPCFIAALVVMLNKTAAVSIVAALAAVFAILSRRVSAGRMMVIVTVSALVAGLSIAVVSTIFLRAIGDVQSALWARQAVGASSLIARSIVYVQAINAWLSYPVQVILGMGPDFLDKSGVAIVAVKFKLSKLAGGAEGTVDSGWLSYLLELGCVTFTVLVGVFVLSIRRVLRCLRSSGAGVRHWDASVYVLGGLVFTVFALSTQMLGYAKISWLPFQLLVMGLLYPPTLRPSSTASQK